MTVAEQGDEPRALVSVVVPVRDGAATIGAQLDALARQRGARAYEVVVADNGSSDGTRDVVLAHRGSPARWTDLHVVDASARPGANVARNAGVAAARGGLVLLCDADDVVDDGWLDALAGALEHADAAGGVLERVSLNPEYVRTWGAPTTNPGTYVHLGFLPRPTGANAGFRRAVWEELGGFDERYVRGGTETEFFWRLQLAGRTLVAAPDAVVHYRLRVGTRKIIRQQYVWGRQSVMLYRDFRASGMAWHPGRAALGWLDALSQVPRAAWGPRAKKMGAARALAQRVGMVAGSIRFRRLYL